MATRKSEQIKENKRMMLTSKWTVIRANPGNLSFTIQPNWAVARHNPQFRADLKLWRRLF